MNPSSKELKQEFLRAVFDQVQEWGNTVVELSEKSITEENPLTELQEKDWQNIRKAAQDFLYLVHHLSALEFGELESQLNNAVSQTFISEQTLRSDFLSNLAHKLRTPLNMIIGFSNVIMKGVDGPINEVQENILSDTKKNGANILHLINQTLRVWRIEEHRAGNRLYQFREEPLWQVVETAIYQIEQNIEVEIRGNVPDNLIIQVDEAKLLKIFVNTATILTDNFRHGRIILSIDFNDSKAVIQLKVKDNNLSDDVLNEFNRVVATSTLFACHHFDNALDLCINQALTEIYDGEIHLDKEGKDSVATFILPVEYSNFQRAS